MDFYYQELINSTKSSMAWSAGLSCFATLVVGGNPITMAGVGALAALTHACASEALRKMDLHPLSGRMIRTGIPTALTLSLQTIGSLLITKNILRLAGGPAFNVGLTAILAVVNVVYYHNYIKKPNNLNYIVLA